MLQLCVHLCPETFSLAHSGTLQGYWKVGEGKFGLGISALTIWFKSAKLES